MPQLSISQQYSTRVHAQGWGLLHNGNGGDEGEVVGGSAGVGEPHLGVDISHVAQAVHPMAVHPVTTDNQTAGQSMVQDALDACKQYRAPHTGSRHQSTTKSKEEPPRRERMAHGRMST